MYAKVLMFSITLLFALPAKALPPEVEADRLAIKAKTALEAKDYAQAAASLAEMEKLGVPLPQSFHYLRGVALNGTQKYGGAKRSLDKYFEITGTAGKHYKEALEAYNVAENGVQESEKKYKQAYVAYEEKSRTRPDEIRRCLDRAERVKDETWKDWQRANEKQDDCYAKLRAGRVYNCIRADKEMSEAEEEWNKISRKWQNGDEEEYCYRVNPEPTPPVKPSLD